MRQILAISLLFLAGACVSTPATEISQRQPAGSPQKEGETLQIQLDMASKHPDYLAGQLAAQLGDQSQAIASFQKADREIREAEGAESAGRIPVLYALMHSHLGAGNSSDAQSIFKTYRLLVNQNADVWEEEETDFGMRHKQSGTVFPARFGTLNREDPQAFALDGSDVSYGYRDGSRYLTIYVTRATPVKDIAQTFSEAERAIFNRLSRAKRLVRHEIPKGAFDQPEPGFNSEYTYFDHNHGTNYRTRLTLFLVEGQFVKFRYTYPEDQTDLADKDLSEGLKAFGWPVDLTSG